VYNGADYLAETLDSLLAQTYTDFDLIISDNASTDGTAEICKRYASMDGRVRYLPLHANIGGIGNHNRLFSLAAGKYFMLASHDDVWLPDYLLRCVQILDSDPTVTLAFCRTAIMDGSSKLTKRLELESHADSPDVVERFAQFVQIYSTLEAGYGVLRTEVLRKVRPYILHPGSDRVWLCELALRGRFVRIPDHLYYRRVHEKGSTQVFPGLRERFVWASPQLAGKRVYPYFGYLWAYLTAMLRTPLTVRQRGRCAWVLLRWVKYHWRELAEDVSFPPASVRAGPAR